MQRCWNKVGSALRTLRLNSLAQFPDQECPKYCPKGAKKWPKYAKNSLLATQISPEGLFGLKGVEQGLNTTWGIPSVRLIVNQLTLVTQCQPWICQKLHLDLSEYEWTLVRRCIWIRLKLNMDFLETLIVLYRLQSKCCSCRMRCFTSDDSVFLVGETGWNRKQRHRPMATPLCLISILLHNACRPWQTCLRVRLILRRR